MITTKNLKSALEEAFKFPVGECILHGVGWEHKSESEPQFIGQIMNWCNDTPREDTIYDSDLSKNTKLIDFIARNSFNLYGIEKFIILERGQTYVTMRVGSVSFSPPEGRTKEDIVDIIKMYIHSNAGACVTNHFGPTIVYKLPTPQVTGTEYQKSQYCEINARSAVEEMIKITNNHIEKNH